MSIVKTELIVTQTDSAYSLPGDWTAAQLVSNYSASIPGLAAMTSTETVETRAEGQVKVITFAPRSGNKG